MAPVVLDTDVASLISKNRLPAALAARLTGTQTGITFVTLGELTKWSVVRGWGAQRRTALEHWLAARPVLAANAEVARTWGELAGYATKRGRPRPVNDMWLPRAALPSVCRWRRSTHVTSKTLSIAKASSSSWRKPARGGGRRSRWGLTPTQYDGPVEGEFLSLWSAAEARAFSAGVVSEGWVVVVVADAERFGGV